VTVRPFMIDASAVSNEQFSQFVEATGYKTDAERFGSSFVFHLHLSKKQREQLKQTRAVVGLATRAIDDRCANRTCRFRMRYGNWKA
jgi:formylglycine-generating enzyme required for sulfatase activity